MIESGERAPDFTVPNQDGEPVTLSELRGRHVVLYFYGVWTDHTERTTFLIDPGSWRRSSHRSVRTSTTTLCWERSPS